MKLLDKLSRLNYIFQIQKKKKDYKSVLFKRKIGSLLDVVWIVSFQFERPGCEWPWQAGTEVDQHVCGKSKGQRHSWSGCLKVLSATDIPLVWYHTVWKKKKGSRKVSWHAGLQVSAAPPALLQSLGSLKCQHCPLLTGQGKCWLKTLAWRWLSPLHHCCCCSLHFSPQSLQSALLESSAPIGPRYCHSERSAQLLPPINLLPPQRILFYCWALWTKKKIKKRVCVPNTLYSKDLLKLMS